jgi:hypothetical protein
MEAAEDRGEDGWSVPKTFTDPATLEVSAARRGELWELECPPLVELLTKVSNAYLLTACYVVLP